MTAHDHFSSLNPPFNPLQLDRDFSPYVFSLVWRTVEGVTDVEFSRALWRIGPDEYTRRAELRDVELLLELTGCLDARL